MPFNGTMVPAPGEEFAQLIRAMFPPEDIDIISFTGKS